MRKKIIIFISLLALAAFALVSCRGNIPTRQQAVDAAMNSGKAETSSADALIHAAQINADAITAAAQINADAITAAAEMIAAAQGNQSIVVNAGTGAASGETSTAAPSTCSVKAVDLMGAWVDAGASETDTFSFTDENGAACNGSFNADILPLFTASNVWFDGSAACSSCHFASSATSAHEMDLTSYAGIMAGADTLSEPPGVPILEPSNWNGSVLRGRLRNNRMPPGWEFDITTTNRNGPCVEPGADGMAPVKDADGKFTYGCDATAVGLLGAWVDAGASESDTFSYAGNDGLTFDKDVLPFFTQSNMWFDGSAACSSCHFANSDTSAHEMDLSSYAGIMIGADSLSEPPGVSILGKQADGTFDWGSSKLRGRLRNNRMPPGWQFDITEGNRNGPLIEAGSMK